MEWTNDTARRFLITYSKYPVLYDPNHEHYKRKHHAESAWQSIKDDLVSFGFTVEELKKKRDSLTGYYRIHLNKIKKMRAKGKQYRTSWFAFETMHKFLSRIYDANVDAEGGDNIEEDDGSASQCLVEEEDLDVDRKPVLVPIELESENDDYSIASNSTNFNRPLACHRVSSIDKLQIKSVKTVEETVEKAESSGKKRMSDIELYAELLVRKMSRLDEDARLGLMNDIDNLVYKTTLEAKRKGNTNSYDPLNEFS